MLPAPAARAAVDMALYDLAARERGVPLVEMLGRAHDTLPTSITIGIKPLEETLAEAAEYVSRGFRILKVKIGLDLERDLERLARLRESVGSRIAIRADGNQGYSRGADSPSLSGGRSLWISSSWSSPCRRARSRRCAGCPRRSASGSPPMSRS